MGSPGSACRHDRRIGVDVRHTAQNLPNARHGDGGVETRTADVADREDDASVGQAHGIVPITADLRLIASGAIERVEGDPGDFRKPVRERGVLQPPRDASLVLVEFRHALQAQRHSARAQHRFHARGELQLLDRPDKHVVGDAPGIARDQADVAPVADQQHRQQHRLLHRSRLAQRVPVPVQRETVDDAQVDVEVGGVFDDVVALSQRRRQQPLVAGGGEQNEDAFPQTAELRRSCGRAHRSGVPCGSSSNAAGLRCARRCE